jgi:hypothetical protein
MISDDVRAQLAKELGSDVVLTEIGMLYFGSKVALAKVNLASQLVSSEIKSRLKERKLFK